MAAPPAEGGRGDGSSEGELEDTKMGDDDQSGKKTVSQPAGTGLTEETTEGAFMVVGTVERTRKLLEKLKMPEVELMTPGQKKSPACHARAGYGRRRKTGGGHGEKRATYYV